jgi:hypothetical protein
LGIKQASSTKWVGRRPLSRVFGERSKRSY